MTEPLPNGPTVRSHYPEYDVMDALEQWDDHTQAIVGARLVREHDYRYLTLTEAELLRAVCSLLAGDDRGEIIQYVLCHIDETLYRNVGESQRKAGVPAARQLIRDGLQALDRASMLRFGDHLFQLHGNEQRQLMLEFGEFRVEPAAVWNGLPQKALFQKLLALTVEAYYSHPLVWSEIGYGGPAYPRGYVRTAIGQTDPWEAKRSHDEA
ncbi:gluconate 2-dehydrogenase subunit 3 family protein [Paenibacillus cymbidii]|uniref:gluconate 2-dehydrogenase subunit 3 family protein n=1 Tax=Paenibacillus cymbidii TaxID=1639034 RepID=UPI00108133ED|nr:gluconate 2-dehydrogenase subunit 3 family protein [Paenibacillus cymbidii]